MNQDLALTFGKKKDVSHIDCFLDGNVQNTKIGNRPESRLNQSYMKRLLEMNIF